MEIQNQSKIEQGSNISQKDLKEIFLTQYNDIFSKILKKSLEDFISLLKQQIILHLRIINKQCDSSLLTNFYEKYQKISNDDKNKITKLYNEIKTYQEKYLTYLNILDIYIHCYKCKEAIHKCGNKLIIYDKYFFCIKCQKVYNEFQIKLYCKECNKTYLTTKREVSEKKNNYLYSISYMKYHCFSENEEKIKCLNCNHDLYYNININSKQSKLKSKLKEQKGIKDIFCIKCKLIFDTSEILFTCKICGENFKAEPQIFRNFPSIKKFLLLLVHTFRKNIYALPDIITNKKCTCDLNGVQYFLHKDNGRLYEGSKDGKNVIICDHCYGIFKSENFNWNCPLCGGSFKALKKYKNMRFDKNKKKISATNTNLNTLNINKEDKNKSEKRKKILNGNKNSNNHIFYNSIGYSNEKTNNYNYESSKQLSRELSLSDKRRNSNLLDSQENFNNINRIGAFNNSDKRIFVKLDENEKNNTTTKKNTKNDEDNSQKLSKYKHIKPAQLFKNNDIINNNYNSKNNVETNINFTFKEENKRSMSYLNKNYNINEEINNISNNSPKNEDEKKRAYSSFRKVLESDSKPLFNIKESICEESIETSSDKKNLKKIKKNIENVLPQNLFLKNKNNNCNNNNISISINNNVIQLRCSPDIKTDNNMQKKKLKARKINKEKNLLKNSSSSKIIKTEKNEINNDIYKKNKNIENNESKEKIKGKSAQKSNVNKFILNKEKDIQPNVNNNLNNDIELLISQSINNKGIKIKKIKKIITTGDKRHIINKEEINNINIANNKKLIKDDNKKVLRRKVKKNELENNSKSKDKQEIKNIQSEKKPNLVTKFNLINIENNNQEKVPVKKVNKIIIKKISDNQINKNIKIINKSKNSNPNVYIITNLSKTTNSINETNKIYNVMVTNSKKEKNYLNIVTDENNNIIYAIPNNIQNKNVILKNEVETKNDNEKNNIVNNSEIEKENGTHKKNNFSFHATNITEIKDINSLKKDIIVINNKKKYENGNNITNNDISPKIVKVSNKKIIKKKKKKIVHNNNPNLNDNNNIKKINSLFNKNNFINTEINENKTANEINTNFNTNNEINNLEYKRNNNMVSNIPSNILYAKNKNNKIILNNINDIEEKHNELRIYFSSMEREISLNKKRRLSLDKIYSRNKITLLTNTNNLEVNTFDSNYYTILRQIGKGSYGKIYLVEDPITKNQFALKKIIIGDSLELKENQEEYKLTWNLTKLNPELKIVKKYAIEIKKLDKYNLVMYVLMEVANCDWEQELINRQKDNAFYTEGELIEILKSLVNTLAELQKKGISHRDVKPQNILCFGKDGYKLSDFGEAKTKKRNYIISNNYEENTKKQTVRGTELYMSPILFKALQMNAVNGAQYNAYKSDVFSLGMCFLLASSLNYQSLYEIREVYDMDILKEIVFRYLKNYSKNYINLIINMLQINEKLRPDFIELNSMIV